MKCLKPLLYAFLLFPLFLSNCKKNPPPPGAVATPPSEAPQHALREILALIPDDARTIAVVRDWKGLHGLLDDLDRAMSRLDAGRELVSQVRTFSASAPVPLPLGARELDQLGLDPASPLAVFGSAEPLVLVAPRSIETFQARMLATWGQGKGTWQKRTQDGLELRVLSGDRPLACAALDRRLLCGESPTAVASALKKRPERSLWHRVQDRPSLLSATLLVGGRGEQVSGLCGITVERDGLSVELSVEGGALKPLTGALDTKGSPALIGSVGDAATALYLRLQFGAVYGLLKAMVPSLAELQLDPIRMQASLSGEILLKEDKERRLLLVLGCRDPGFAQEAADVLAGLIRRQAASSGLQLKLSEEKVGQARRYRLDVETPSGLLPLKLSLGLAAGRDGLLLGSAAAVKAALDGQAAAPAAKAAEAPAAASDLVFLLRSPVADLLSSLGPAPEKMLQGARLPPSVLSWIQVGRFMLDQMYGQSLEVRQLGVDSLALRLRLTTLHRGEPGDEQARELWAKALVAGFQSDGEARSLALRQLQTEHAQSRYAERARETGPGLLSSLLTGVLFGVGLPAFQKYQQEARLTEVRAFLARMAMGGRFAYETGKDGKPGFPETVEWTPSKPCCAQGGQCSPSPDTWSHPTWQTLRFSVDEPHRFQYRFVNRGKGFLAQARGDLDCVGQVSIYTVEGTLNPDDNSVTLAEMKVAIEGK